MRWGSYVAGLAVALPILVLLAVPTSTALTDLAAARAERDRLAAVLARPERSPAPLVTGLSGEGGARAMANRVRSLARTGGVLVEDVAVLAMPERSLAGVRMRVSGPEKAVLALADTLEREPPLVRFRRWKLEAVAANSVRLEAELVGPW